MGVESLALEEPLGRSYERVDWLEVDFKAQVIGVIAIIHKRHGAMLSRPNFLSCLFVRVGYDFCGFKVKNGR